MMGMETKGKGQESKKEYKGMGKKEGAKTERYIHETPSFIMELHQTSSLILPLTLPEGVSL